MTWQRARSSGVDGELLPQVAETGGDPGEALCGSRRLSPSNRSPLNTARPHTTYFVQRAPEIGRTLGSDGVCQRALGLSPWSAADPAAPSFITFQMPNAGPAVTMTTSATGSASISFTFVAPTITAGTLFDVMFRLVDNESAPATELRSGCFSVLVK